MSDSGGIPEIQCSHQDGRPRTRLEMDQWLRKEVPKVHWLRIHACRTLGLPKQISWDMKEIVLRHWILDELIRRQRILGDLLGVNATSYNDEAELRQFEQRLAALLQAGQAVQPQHAEGIDMNGYTPPPPPVMGGAPQPQSQPTYQPGPPAPQGPPPGVPVGHPSYAAPHAPPGPPQQQYQPPGPPSPNGYAQPPTGVPMGPPAGPPPASPPPAAAPRRGRPRADASQSAPPPPATHVPQMASVPGVPQAPQGFVPAGFQPPGAQSFAPPAPAPTYSTAGSMAIAPHQAPVVDLSGVLAKLDQILNTEHSTEARFAALEKRIEVLSMVNTTLCRAMYQMGGTPDAEAFLKELQEMAAKATQQAQQNPPR